MAEKTSCQECFGDRIRLPRLISNLNNYLKGENMKRTQLLISTSMFFCLVVIGCKSPNNYGGGSSSYGGESRTSTDSNRGKLTTAKAQDAVDRAMEAFKSKLGDNMDDNAKAVVQGVQEIPEQNMAQAEVRYINAAAGCAGVGTVPWKSGVATFKHYNDGRWVLTKLSTGEMMCYPGADFSIEVR